MVLTMAILVVEFSREGYKILKKIAKNQLQSNEMTKFEELEYVVARCQKTAEILLLKSIFYVKNHPNLLIFFSMKNTDLCIKFRQAAKI